MQYSGPATIRAAREANKMRLNESNRADVNAALLCACAGFADAVGFVHAGVFAANMTGNTVLTGLSLAHGDWAASIERAATLVTFFVGAMIGRVLLRVSGDRSWLVLLVEAVVITLAAFVDPKAPLSIWAIAAAMGVQATAMTKFRGAAVSTVVITSTMARIAEAAADLVLAPMGLKRTQGTPTHLLAVTWIFYGLGAIVAALLMPVMSFPLLIAAAMVLAVCGIEAFLKPRPKAA